MRRFFRLPNVVLQLVFGQLIARVHGLESRSTDMSYYDIQKVKDQMISLASHSWEFGAASEALLELENPEISVFGENPFPIPTSSICNQSSLAALEYVKPYIQLNSSELVDGDGAVGDPASLGVFAVLLGQSDGQYLAAAQREIDFILSAPRWPNGAISHRIEAPELWADFIYMTPPFLAYYGAATKNASLLKTAVTQCGLYRDVLQTRNGTSRGLWTHIDGPLHYDPGHWSTGNAWAAAGMTRVLATVTKAPPGVLDQKFVKHAEINLKTWIKEILDGAMAMQEQNGLLRNYLDDASWFGEISGTALLAATAYRVHAMDKAVFGSTYRDWADVKRSVIMNCTGADGIVAPAVNPLGWGDTTPDTSGSPEGQAFAVLLHAAYEALES